MKQIKYHDNYLALVHMYELANAQIFCICCYYKFTMYGKCNVGLFTAKFAGK